MEYLFTKTKLLHHPINSNIYESKICIFGKYIINLLLVYLFIQIFYNISKKLRIIVLIITFTLSLMNLNATLYLLPYFIYEIYKLL